MIGAPAGSTRQPAGGTTRTASPEVKAFADAQKLKLADSYEALLADPNVNAVVLATPHSMHASQVIAAAKAGKHVFCEKPFALTKAHAEAAVAATTKAGVTLGLGYNRRFHPEMTKLRNQIRSGDLEARVPVQISERRLDVDEREPESLAHERPFEGIVGARPFA